MVEKLPYTPTHVFLWQLWMRLSGALQKKRTSEIPYREIIKNSSNDDSTTAKQVKQHCSEDHLVCRAELCCTTSAFSC